MSTDELWASGDAYEPYVGRWSRLVAAEFVPWLAAEPGKRWLDVGCGTGELSRAILALAAPESVQGIEPSDAFRAYARAHTLHTHATFAAGDAQHLPVDDASVDCVVSGLVLNFVPDTRGALDEFRRVSVAGGMIAAYVWDYAVEMQMMRYFWDAAIALDAAAAELDEGARFPICRERELAKLFTDAGLRDVASEPIDIATRFRDFDDYWQPFLAGYAPAPQYAMSLSEDRRAELRELLRTRLPIAADGAVSLVARAWAAKGRA
jgi:SAM-dependent methyltransferase